MHCITSHCSAANTGNRAGSSGGTHRSSRSQLWSALLISRILRTTDACASPPAGGGRWGSWCLPSTRAAHGQRTAARRRYMTAPGYAPEREQVVVAPRRRLRRVHRHLAQCRESHRPSRARRHAPRSSPPRIAQSIGVPRHASDEGRRHDPCHRRQHRHQRSLTRALRSLWVSALVLDRWLRQASLAAAREFGTWLRRSNTKRQDLS